MRIPGIVSTPGARCGDGEVQAEEERDDGEMPDLAKCSKECAVLSRVIFLYCVEVW